MKKSMTRSIFAILPVLFGLAIVLSSCSANLHSPITKRHYRKGFHVDFAHKARPARAVETDKLELSNTKVLESVAEKNAGSPSLYANTKEDFSQLVIPADKPADPYTPQQLVKKKSPIKSVVTNMVKPITKAKQNVADVAGSGRSDGLSLLWLVIVVVLLLWLLAFLMGGWGLGGLIHLLLLVALILLILWLLGIV